MLIILFLVPKASTADSSDSLSTIKSSPYSYYGVLLLHIIIPALCLSAGFALKMAVFKSDVSCGLPCEDTVLCQESSSPSVRGCS